MCLFVNTFTLRKYNKSKNNLELSNSPVKVDAPKRHIVDSKGQLNYWSDRLHNLGIVYYGP